MWERLAFLLVYILVIAEQVKRNAATTLDSIISGNDSSPAFRTAPTPRAWEDVAPRVLPPQHGEKPAPINSTGGKGSLEKRLVHRLKRGTPESKQNAYNYMDNQWTKFETCHKGQLQEQSRRKLYASWGRTYSVAGRQRKNETPMDCVTILRELLKSPKVKELPAGAKFSTCFLIALVEQKHAMMRSKMNDEITRRRAGGYMSRIVGGNNAPDGEYPFMASIKTDNGDWCGATIVNKRWLLTAAQCIEEENYQIDGWRVVVGTRSLDGADGDSYVIEKVLTHPDYMRYRLKNDVGLMRVDRDIEFGNKVKPIELPDKGCDEVTGQVVVLGWGYTSHGGSSPTFLQYHGTKLISKDSCQSAKPCSPLLTDEQICTQSAPGEGICYGDSGSPLMVGNVQIGIVSRLLGRICADGSPTIYTRVCKFIPWIKESIN